MTNRGHHLWWKSSKEKWKQWTGSSPRAGLREQRRPTSRWEQGWCRGDAPRVSSLHLACAQGEGGWSGVWQGSGGWRVGVGPWVGQDVVTQEFWLKEGPLLQREKERKNWENITWMWNESLSWESHPRKSTSVTRREMASMGSEDGGTVYPIVFPFENGRSASRRNRTPWWVDMS